MPGRERIIAGREQRLEVPRRIHMVGQKCGGELRLRWDEMMELSGLGWETGSGNDESQG